MFTVDATELKNRLGAVLARAEFEKVAIRKHGRVVAYLTPASHPHASRQTRAPTGDGLTRDQQEALVQLCAGGDFRPSRWARAGDPTLLAGVATMLASQPEFDRVKMLALAERLHPGMSTTPVFAQWLRTAPLKASRFLPMVRAELRQRPR